MVLGKSPDRFTTAFAVAVLSCLCCMTLLHAADGPGDGGTVASETLAAGTGWNYWQSEASGGEQVELPQGGRNGAPARGFRRVSRGILNKIFALEPGCYEVRFWVRQTGRTAALGVGIEPEQAGHPLAAQSLRLRPAGEWQEVVVPFRVPNSADPAAKPLRSRILLSANQVDDELLVCDLRLLRRACGSPIVNGDFEDGGGLVGWKDAYWKGLEAHGEAARHEGGVAGAAAARVEHVSGQEKVGISQIVSASALAAASDWVLEGWTNTPRTGSSDLGIRLLDDSGNILWQREALGRAEQAHAGAGWMPLSLRFRLLPGTASVEVLCIHLGRGDGRFDGVRLRPGGMHEMAGFDPLPSRIGITPLDSTHRLREYGEDYHYPVLSRQPNLVAVHLDSPNFKPDAATLEIAVPQWLELTRAAYGYAPWSQGPVEVEHEEQGDRVVHRVRSLTSWNATKGRSNSNQYEVLVFNADAAPGTTGTAEARLLVDGKPEARFPFTVEVLEPLPPKPAGGRFPIFFWSCQHNMHPGPEASAVLDTFARAGIGGSTTLAASLALRPIAEQPGWNHVYSLPVSSHLPHIRSIMRDAAPAAVQADGTSSHEYTNIGRSIGDEVLRRAWRQAITPILASLPPDPVVFWNGEFWGKGSTRDICFAPETLRLFREFAKLPETAPLDAATILKERYDAWSGFRQWTTARIAAEDAADVRKVRPDARVAIYTYPLTREGKAPRFVKDSPMNPLLWEEGIDINLVSMYSLFGATYLDILDTTVKGLKKPVWSCPYLTKTVQFLDDTGYADCDAKEWHLQIVGAAATGAKGMAPYPGCTLDGRYLTATRKAVDAVEEHAAFYFDGARCDERFSLEGGHPALRHRGHVAKDGRLLVTLFNTTRQPQKVAVRGPGDRVVERSLEPMEVAIAPWR